MLGIGLGLTGAVVRRLFRRSKALTVSTSLEWYADKVLSRITTTMGHRVQVATNHLRAKTVANISIPVVVVTGAKGAEVVVERSKPGEFPRQETGLLMSSITARVYKEGKRWQGGIYSSAPYAPYLESQVILNRVFLQRTLLEEAPRIRRILSGRIR